MTIDPSLMGDSAHISKSSVSLSILLELIKNSCVVQSIERGLG